MKNLIFFVSVTAMYVGLSEALPPTKDCNDRTIEFQNKLGPELSPPTPPCNNGLRSWIVKSDGIYFERNGKKPMKLVGRWKSGPY
ncbi:hypothetical protein HID58_030610 [Brassica napus]|uniref:Secreted protein n=1 Tax=Brassica napus TaxID=3708 RepID=A0ABQ8CGE5_BRANA|nr:hypothetical protein HID58_030610 [Brassica napus]